MGKEGSAVNRTSLKESFIGLSTLTATQKTLAAENLNACLDADFSWLPAFQGKPAPAGLCSDFSLLQILIKRYVFRHARETEDYSPSHRLRFQSPD